MKRLGATFAGILVLAGVGIFIGRTWLESEGDAKAGKDPVLTGGMTPFIEDFVIVEDADLPDELPQPRMGENFVYLRVTVFYPGLPEVPEPRAHRLAEIDGDEKAETDVLVVDMDADETGARVDLFFRVDPDFAHARLFRGKELEISQLSFDE